MCAIVGGTVLGILVRMRSIIARGNAVLSRADRWRYILMSVHRCELP
jgi:hypothetical protein